MRRLCAALKIRENEQAFLLEQCEKYSQKAGEYDRRFALVMLSGSPFIRTLFGRGVRDSRKNRLCAVLRFYGGGLVRFGFVCPRQRKTLAFLKTSALDNQTHRRAIQKIVESNRVTAEEKAFVRTLRRA